MILSSYTLEQLDKFIAGNAEELVYSITNENGLPMDVSTMTLKFAISNYSDRYTQPILVKDGIPSFNTETNITSDFKVKLETVDTLNMCGKYIYQLSIADYDKDVRNYQGVMVIDTNTNKTGVLTQIL